MDATLPTSYTLSDHLGMLRRQWWIVLTLAVAGLLGATAYTATEPKVYESETSVLVQSAGGGDNVVGGRTKGELNLDTEAQLVRSTAVAVEAGRLLRVGTPPDTLARAVSVDVPANTSVLVIRFAAGSPSAAQAGSHAFAEAYLRNREGSATADLASQTAILETKLRQLNASLTQINTQLAELLRDSAERENLDSQRGTIVNQINTLAGRLNQLSTSTISAGKIISDARLPASPAQPSTPVNLASGGMLGLLLGLGLALARERFDRRVRVAADVPRRAGVPVLAEVPTTAPPPLDRVYPPHGAGGRTFNRLRNEILASLDAESRVVLVTGASRGQASALVAANLAAALARTGSEAALVCAHLPDSLAERVSVDRLIGVHALPGLSDVLAGRVRLADALQDAPRTPRLRVLTAGGAATAAGLLQSPALRETLSALREQTRYVVVEAPSTAASADAQSLAGQADAAILVVELRCTRHGEVTDAAEQLRRIGTPLLGAVVLPRVDVPEPAIADAVLPPLLPAPLLPAGLERPALPAAPAQPAPADDQTMVFRRLDAEALAELDKGTAAPEPAPPLTAFSAPILSTVDDLGNVPLDMSIVDNDELAHPVAAGDGGTR